MPSERKRRQPRISGRRLATALQPPDRLTPPEPFQPQARLQEPAQAFQLRRERFAWAYGVVFLLGIWLMAAPTALGYGGAVAWSDVGTGGVIALFTFLALWPRLDVPARAVVCGAALWLLMAPLAFNTDSAAAYANSTIVGLLVLALALTPPIALGGSGRYVEVEDGGELPPGWSFNPSSWWQRAPIVLLAFLSLLMARYMAAFQLGHIDAAWDPFFGTGTEEVLLSDISEAFPVPDAGLGAIAYGLEGVTALIGSARRWRTMPWMVAVFGVLVVPLGITSIVLIMLQPVAVGAWCTLCLASAGLLLLMIPLAIPEVIAMLQMLLRVRRERRSVWTAFWAGEPASAAESTYDVVSPSFGAPSKAMLSAMVSGVSVGWNVALSVVVGVMVMAAPDAFGIEGAGADAMNVLGALAIVIAFVSMAEVVRRVRHAGAVVGVLLVAAAVLPGHETASMVVAVAAGAALVILSLPRGPVNERYGALQRIVG